MEIKLELESFSHPGPLVFTVKRMVNAGYTGRNQVETRRHIEELAAQGIPGPASTPTLYPVIPETLFVDPASIQVYSEETCGEVEYVLLVENKDRIFVGLGSDHTDRCLEESDIPRAKQICPNLLSQRVWPLEEVQQHWDELIIRCRQKSGGEMVLYQQGALELIYEPRALLDFVSSRIPGPLDNLVIFSGTIGNLTDGFVFGQWLGAELEDPILGRRLELSYDINTLDYLNP